MQMGCLDRLPLSVARLLGFRSICLSRGLVAPTRMCRLELELATCCLDIPIQLHGDLWS